MRFSGFLRRSWSAPAALLLSLAGCPSHHERPAASAQPVPPVPGCPFADSADDIEVELLYGRVRLTLPTANARMVDAIEFVSGDPHAVAPTSPWRAVVLWSGEEDITGLLIIDDPLALAPANLGTAARQSARVRFGDPFVPSATEAPLAMAAPDTTALLLSGPRDGLWGAAGTVRLPDGSAIDIAVSLHGRFADDPGCRAAALRRLASLHEGPRPMEEHDEEVLVPVGLTAGGELTVPVPPGFTFRIQGGWEFQTAEVWRRAEYAPYADREGIVYTTTIAPGSGPWTPGGPVTADATLLGEPTTWWTAPDAPNQERAVVQGWFGQGRGTPLTVSVQAATAERRAALREVAQRSTIGPAPPAPPAPSGGAPPEQ